MPISEIHHHAKVSYSTEQTHSQKVLEIKSDDPRHSNRSNLSGAQKIALDVVEFSSQASSTVSKPNENPDDAYKRPIPPELLRNKMLLEAIFEVDIQDENSALADAINKLSLTQSSSSLDHITNQRPISIEDLEKQGPVTITAFGQSFAEDSDLVIMDVVTDSQALNFSTSGIYNINDNVFHSTFEL